MLARMNRPPAPPPAVPFAGRPDPAWRKARLIARILRSPRMQERAKWCNLAKQLAADPDMENRLIGQAMKWFAYDDAWRAQQKAANP